MADEVEGLRIKVDIDASAVETGVEKTKRGIFSIHKSVEGVNGAMGGLKSTVLGVFGGNLLTQGFMGFEHALAEAKNEAIQTQAAQTRLAAALDNMKGVTSGQKESIKSDIEAIQGLGFSSSETTTAMGTLVTATGNVDQATRIMAVATDLARYKHIDLNTAATILARGTQGSAKAFKELGITLDTTLPKNQAIAKAFDQLNDKIHGQATAYTQTFAGKVAILKEKFNDIVLTLSQKLLPILSKVLGWFITALEWVKQNSSALKVFAIVIGSVIVAYKAWIVVQTILNTEMELNPIGLIITAIGLLAIAFVTAWNHLEWFRKLFAFLAATIVNGVGIIATQIYFFLKLMSKIPLIGDKFKIAADGVKSFMGDVAKATKAVDQLSNKKIQAPKLPPVVLGTTDPGKSTGIIGTTPGGGASAGGGGGGTVQNITVYASDTNDIYKKLSRAAKSGVPLGSR